ncbi:MAG: 2-hydroxychromene-2-carboxylate isomerase, partial [Pseudomonadota bacterium]
GSRTARRFRPQPHLKRAGAERRSGDGAQGAALARPAHAAARAKAPRRAGGERREFEAMQVRYFFSLMSPYAYLAGLRLEEIAAARGVAVAYRPFDAPTVFAATGGLPVAQRHPARRAYRLQDLRRRAHAARAPLILEPPHYPVDAGLAATALLAAQAAGLSVGPAAHSLLRAVWADGGDLGDPTVVEAALRRGGVDPEAFAPQPCAAISAALYEASTREAIDAGVFGSPFYIFGEERFWGQDRLDDLDGHLRDAAEEPIR